MTKEEHCNGFSLVLRGVGLLAVTRGQRGIPYHFAVRP